jgi:epoxyqueuosine reductase
MPDDLTARLKAEAMRLGFDFVGIAPAVTPSGYPHFLDWLDAGCAAGMDYLPNRAEARANPESVLPGVRSVIVAGFIYGVPAPPASGATQGKVARYAQGGDYHRLLWDRLGQLLDWLVRERPGTVGRAVSDTAPILERDFARLAGLGWIGKNTMLISPKLGSFTVLGALLVDAELECDSPFEADRCGTCTRCLDACPTDAFDGPHRLDARRCISYWTIEHRGPMPDVAAGSLDGWAFGCDVCQDVCPWNRKAPAGREPTLAPREEWVNPDLLAWLDREADTWTDALRGTALKRAKRSGLVRNAALILGSRGVREAVPSLTRLLDDPDPTVRWAADWALRRIVGETPESPAPDALSMPAP